MSVSAISPEQPLFLLSISGVGNCIHGCYDPLYEGCIMTRKQLYSLLGRLMKTKEKYFIQDYTSDGNKCLIKLKLSHIFKNLKQSSISKNEAEDLTNSGMAFYPDKCQWFQSFIQYFK